MAAEPKPPTDAQILEKFALFGVLRDEDRRALAERSHRARFHAGEPIFHFGDPGQSVMAVVKGSVRISRPMSKGKEMILGDVGPGEIIGEIAVLDGKERSADATALTNVELLVLDRREILPFLAGHPELCLRLLNLLCARLRLAEERMADVGFVDLPVRLAKALLRNAVPTSKENVGNLRLSLSQTVLAEMIGGTRETVNRQLHVWQESGVLRRDQGWIVILDQTALRALAQTR
jgi:CRP/FNR family cyclic AMP-dependent transcriptional regulator